MNKLLLIATALVLSTHTLAADKKKSSTNNAPAMDSASAPSYSSNYSNYGSSSASMTATMGFAVGAVNLGVDYVKKMDPVDLGGYVFLQTEKKKNNTALVNQMTSFGAIAKFHLLDTSKLKAYIAPGFGLHMTKDSSDSSKTVVGPIMKIGAQIALNSKTALGLENTQIVNWFEDSVTYSANYYSAALTFEF